MQSWLTVVEIGAIHKLLLERFQQQYVDYLKGQLLPTLRLSTDNADGFITALIQVRFTNDQHDIFNAA